MSHTIFLIIALVTTGIFLIQFVLSIFFGDIDADVDVDADISSVVSFKGLTHFGIGFGWYMYLAGNTEMQSYIIGILVGLFFVLPCGSSIKSLSTATSKPQRADRSTCGTGM